MFSLKPEVQIQLEEKINNLEQQLRTTQWVLKDERELNQLLDREVHNLKENASAVEEKERLEKELEYRKKQKELREKRTKDICVVRDDQFEVIEKLREDLFKEKELRKTAEHEKIVEELKTNILQDANTELSKVQLNVDEWKDKIDTLYDELNQAEQDKAVAECERDNAIEKAHFFQTENAQLMLELKELNAAVLEFKTREAQVVHPTVLQPTIIEPTILSPKKIDETFKPKAKG